MAMPNAYVYLTESARGFVNSELGRMVVEGPSGPDDGYGRIKVGLHSLTDGGWVRLSAFTTAASKVTDKMLVILPSHAVAGIADIPSS